MSKITSEDFSAAFWAYVRHIGTAIGAVVLIGGASWQWIVKPALDGYLDDRDLSAQANVATMAAAVAANTLALTELKNEIKQFQRPVPFLEFRGRGSIARSGHFAPGDTVPVRYFLRRNNPCPTVVRVQFYRAESNRVVSSYTYDIPARQANATFDFAGFTVDLQLPSEMRDGHYSYEPILKPDRAHPDCNGQAEILPPPSNFFEVRNGT